MKRTKISVFIVFAVAASITLSSCRLFKKDDCDCPRALDEPCPHLIESNH